MDICCVVDLCVVVLGKRHYGLGGFVVNLECSEAMAVLDCGFERDVVDGDDVDVVCGEREAGNRAG